MRTIDSGSSSTVCGPLEAVLKRLSPQAGGAHGSTWQPPESLRTAPSADRLRMMKVTEQRRERPCGAR